MLKPSLQLIFASMSPKHCGKVRLFSGCCGVADINGASFGGPILLLFFLRKDRYARKEHNVGIQNHVKIFK